MAKLIFQHRNVIQTHINAVGSPIFFKKYTSSWWFQLHWKICSSKRVHLPQIGVKIKNLWNHLLVPPVVSHKNPRSKVNPQLPVRWVRVNPAFVRQDDSSSEHNKLVKYVFATGHRSPRLDMYTVYLVGGWTTHLKNVLVKMGSSSPIWGMKSPKIFELPPPRSIRVSF